ncbi:hypothetical protein B0T21DRAFT_108541 [Apiosordaria backusii]|uniref:Uncharacterized protein n=1 Tax=Apiosordaria backusii TaxID=314023 RepID=A0AA39ZSK5_9PEZI|nr:hypothetical protein B0T21DRAFT_108541 [Apiosordaria backusii]
MIGAIEVAAGSGVGRKGDRPPDHGRPLVYKYPDFFEVPFLLPFSTSASQLRASAPISGTPTQTPHTNTSNGNRPPHLFNMPSQCNCTSCSCTTCDGCKCCVSCPLSSTGWNEADTVLAPDQLSFLGPNVTGERDVAVGQGVYETGYSCGNRLWGSRSVP